MSVEIVKPKVILIAKPATFDGTRLSGIAAKTCTTAETFAEILDTNDNYEGVLKRVLGYGHLSVTEFDNWVFGIENVSRTLTHQLVRKRLASYAQESMRYTSQGGTYKIIEPASLEGKSAIVKFDINKLPEYITRFIPKDNLEAINHVEIELSLEELASISHEWYEGMQEQGVPNEDARFGLLEASKTKILVGMNTHALLDFFCERTCTCAQWEIRGVAQAMLRLAKEADPVGMATAGPKCTRTYFCHEAMSKWETCKRVTHIDTVKQMVENSASNNSGYSVGVSKTKHNPSVGK
jgi:thymidylate synthase (FAD)